MICEQPCRPLHGLCMMLTGRVQMMLHKHHLPLTSKARLRQPTKLIYTKCMQSTLTKTCIYVSGRVEMINVAVVNYKWTHKTLAAEHPGPKAGEEWQVMAGIKRVSTGKTSHVSHISHGLKLK